MILELVKGCVIKEERLELSGEDVDEKILFLKERGVEQLICGAISSHAREEAESMGVEVYGFVSGCYREIIDAWRNGILEQEEYAMPGCRRNKNCHRSGWKINKWNNDSLTKFPGRCGYSGREDMEDS